MRLIHQIKGYLSPRSHYRYDGTPKVQYNTRATAEAAALYMSEKLKRPQEAYRCWFYCRKFHIGRAA